MSIFDRLYNIAKAEVNHRLKHGIEGRTWHKRTTAEQDSSYDDFEEPSHDYDASSGSSAKVSQVDQWYAALEVPPGSDLATVQKAWKNLLRKYHPDMHSGDPEQARIAHEVSQQLNQAYKGLKAHLK